MDPINPWLDPVEVRRLADRLMRPMRDPGVTVTDAGFDDGFVGYAAGAKAAHEPAAVAVPARVVGPPNEEAPADSLTTPAPQAPQDHHQQPIETTDQSIESSARGPFLDRIRRFRDWMRHHFSATGIFILDREGAVIFDESNHGRLHFLARSLALASRRPGSTTGNVHVKIGAAATLEVIPVETPFGCLVLGAVVPEALDTSAVAAVMEALGQVATPQ